MIYTDALQTVVMLVGAVTLMGYSKWGRAWQHLSRPGPLLSALGSAVPAARPVALRPGDSREENCASRETYCFLEVRISGSPRIDMAT